jgi:probable O-glycosylation ligase (exosortase A-associated)
MTILFVLFAAWATMSTFLWAVVPASAALKWNSVVKTLLFAAFIPLAIRSRVQIEAFLQIWLFGFAINFLPGGLKVLVSGGGYGRDLGISPSGIGAFQVAGDARLATLALMFVPIMLFLRQHGKILPVYWLTSAMYFTMIVLAASAAYGTYERTALIVAAVLAALLWLKARRKILTAIALAAAIPIGVFVAPTDWLDRMATMTDPHHETSAEHRLDVWSWTFNYALEHPLGGGFQVYEINQLGGANAEGPRLGMAYHNDFFEVLGELGWPGLVMFIGLIATSILYLRGAARRARRLPHLAWCSDLAAVLQMALVLQLTGGSFVALGFHPPLYMIFALSISLREYVYRVEKASQRTTIPVSGFAASGFARAADPRARFWKAES